MKRDWRLLAALPLLLASAILFVLHVNRAFQWSIAWATNDEETMQKVFGVSRIADCTYHCYPIGDPGDYYGFPALILFLIAFTLVGWAWWKPRG